MKYDQERFIESLQKLTKQEIDEVVAYIQSNKRVELQEAIKRFDLGPMGSSVCPRCGK